MKKVNRLTPKALCLISGGIDSPVAAYLMANQGYALEFIFFSSEYASPKEKEIVVSCVRQLKKELGIKKAKLFIIPHSETLRSIIKNCQRNLQCILCKRMMLRIAEKIARQEKCAYLVTGDNLGQVASQTLHNLVVVSSAVKIPVLRPLLCFDKNDTTKISEQIGTFQHSKFHKCCGLLPPSPRTKGRLYEAENAEKNLNVKKLVTEAMRKKKIMII
jgi:thiamine biosynthesis protein ThiI